MTSILLILTLFQALTVRGTVLQNNDKPVPDAVVTMVGSDGTHEVTSDKDGTFKVSLSKPGYFQLSARRGKFSGQPSTIFVDKDMDGVGIVLRSTGSVFTGSVRVEDNQALPKERLKIVIKYPSGTVISRADVSQMGLFFFGAAAEEFNIGLEGLSESYFVKSITFGELDLMKNPMNLLDAPPELKPIVIILGRK